MSILGLVSTVEQAIPQANTDEQAISALEAALRAVPELSSFDGKMQYVGMSYASTSFKGLATWLARRASEVGGAQAVADLERYLNSAQLPHRHVMVLGGITVTERIEVTPAITLLPFSDLSPGHWKAALEREYERFHENHRPSAGLEQKIDLPRRHIERTDPVTFPDDPYRQLHDVRLCMTVLGPSSPVWLGNWTEEEEWIPSVGGSGAAIPRLFDVEGFPRDRAGTWNELPAIYRAWLKLSETMRARMRVPLRHLARAQRRTDLVDSAIDFGVAIDSLFLAEREADRGELGLTLRLRAARLLGSTFEERRQLSKFFSNAYRVRSAAVHAGTVPADVDGTQVRKFLRQGFEYTARAARMFIERGEPDWQRLMLE